MLNVQKYLLNHILSDLEEQFGIVITRYDDRIVLNYNHLDSPKFHPVCNECRGLILSWPNLDVLCRPFNRFYNYGEGGVFSEKEFSLNRMVCQDKIDGSLVSLFADDNGWQCATRKRAFAEGETVKGNTFKDVVDRAFPDWKEKMDILSRDFTYICEVVSPETRVVVPYSKYHIYLLAIRNNKDGSYIDIGGVESAARKLLGIYTPKRHKFNNLNEIIESSKRLEPMDENGEGYVAFDHKTQNRVKIKNPTYVQLSHLRENGAISNKRITKLVFDQDYEEYLQYFECDREFFTPYIEAFDSLMKDIYDIWEKNKDIESQKEFALNVKDLKISSVMFQLRKGLTLKDIFDKIQDRKKQELLENYKE